MSRQLFISYYPLKQGLKLFPVNLSIDSVVIYILLSIKTRIETVHSNLLLLSVAKFISYYPLKQGLKLSTVSSFSVNVITFISYYPLKQGLKLMIENIDAISLFLFISYYPLKQGLKPP